jgi:hypothetical protein
MTTEVVVGTQWRDDLYEVRTHPLPRGGTDSVTTLDL